MNIRFRFAAIGVVGLGLGGLAVAEDITGAGATFPAPLYAKWAADYNKATGVKINYQSVGSGAGIKQIDSKTVAFGASDMPLKDDDLRPFPSCAAPMVPAPPSSSRITFPKRTRSGSPRSVTARP